MEGSKKAKHYKELLVWQKGMALAREIYELTGGYPSNERFGLTAQMRRAAVSVPSNIAEGQARHGTREFLQFLSHSSGSLAELETQILLSAELGYGGKAAVQDVLSRIAELQNMLRSLKCSLEALASH